MKRERKDEEMCPAERQIKGTKTGKSGCKVTEEPGHCKVLIVVPERGIGYNRLMGRRKQMQAIFRKQNSRTL